MHLDKIEVRNFGKLEGLVEFCPNKCNILRAPNEYGKTTLADAILFALYCPPTRAGARDRLRPLDRYVPWENPQARKQIRLWLKLSNSRRYRIEATFANRSINYQLVDLDTNQVLAIPNNSFGEHYLGVSLPVCLRSFVLRQESLLAAEENSSEELAQAIEQAAMRAAATQGASVRSALAALESARFSFEGSSLKPRKVLERLSASMAQLEEERAELEAERQNIAQSIEQLHQLRQEIESLERALKATELLHDTARLKEIEADLKEQERRRQKHSALLAEKESLAPFAAHTTEDLGELQKLYGQLEGGQKNLAKLRENHEHNVVAELSKVIQQLSALPEEGRQVTEQLLGRFKRLLGGLAQLEHDIAELEQSLRAKEENLAQQGVDIHLLLAIEEKLHRLDKDETALLMGGYFRKKSEKEDELAKLRTEITELERQHSQWEQRLGRSKSVAWILFVLALLGGAASIFHLLQHDLRITAVVGVVALLSLIGGTFAAARSHRLRQNQVVPLREQLASVQSRARTAQESLDELHDAYEKVRAKAAISSAELVDLERYSQFSGAAAEVVRLRAELVRQRQAYATNLAEARELALAAEPHLPDTPTVAELEAVSGKLEKILNWHRERAQLEKEDEKARQEITQQEKHLNGLERSMRQILSKVGIEGESLVECINIYKENLQKAEKYRKIAAQLEAAHLLSPEREKQLQKERERLQEKIAQAKAASFSPPPEDVAEGRLALKEQLEALRAELNTLRERHQRLLLGCEGTMAKYRKRMPELEEEIARKRALVQRFSRTVAAMELAAENLETIGENLSRMWQRELRERLEKYLPELLPHYIEPGVSDDLQLTLRDRQTGRVLEGNRDLGYLSKGTRDQLDLLMRIAAGEILTASTEPLPLLLDEPFAHWDDERFVQGLRFLSKIAEQRQVIVLTCHSWRIDKLSETHPSLYNELFFAKLDALTN